MLKKWKKTERNINRLLTWFGTICQKLFFKVFPQKWWQKILSFKEWLLTQKTKWLQKTKETAQLAVTKSKERKNKLIEKVKSIKPRIDSFMQKVREFKFKEKVFKVPTKQDLKSFWLFIKSFPPKLKNALRSFIPENYRDLTIHLALVIIPALFALIFLGRQLIVGEQKSRDPASIKRVFKNPRPKYYHKYDRQLTLRSINFPVYIESTSGSKMLRMDITVTTSNKFTKNYLNEHYHLVLDKLNTYVEPVVPGYPLEKSGKEIIKEKVRAEIDKLIKEKKIEGKVEAVHIHSILNG